MLTFRQLEAFRAVMDAGSVVKAASLMGLSQPAVSRLLADLESAVGYRLFDRRRGRLMPLSEARELYKEVDRSFSGLARIAEVAERIGHKKTKSIRVAAIPALLAGPMPDVVARFLERYPDVFLSLEARTRAQILEGLADGLHDIGLASPPDESPDVGIIRYLTSDCVCLVPARHPLADRDVITAEDLDGVDCIMSADRTPMRVQVGKALAESGARPIVRAELSSTRAAIALTTRGVGICLAWRFADQDAISDDVRVVPFRPKITIELAILYPTAKPPEGIVAAFVDAYLQAAGEWQSDAGFQEPSSARL